MSEIVDDHMGYISDEIEALESDPWAMQDYIDRQEIIASRQSASQAGHERREAAYQERKRNMDKQRNLF